MDAIVLFVVLLALAAWVAAPLYRAQPAGPARSDRGDLLAHKDALVTALRELELDHQTGLLSDDDYTAQRAAAEAEAADALRTLESDSGIPSD